MAATIKLLTWKSMLWLAARRPNPVPLSRMHGQICDVLRSPAGTAVLLALGTFVLVQALRSAWFDIHGRWHG